MGVDGGTVDFSRDIRPILSDRCFKCHGFDDKTRDADVGLHTFEAATRDLGGYKAITPGDPDASEIIQRMLAEDSDEVMPPPKANKARLTEEEVALFKQWISEGAEYVQHWSFVPPERPQVPPMESKLPASKLAGPTEIDAFVQRRLKAEGLAPSAEADRATLIRRVSLDLTGLPPTPQEVDAFVADTSADAYEKLVDRLLRSPQYGERWARPWLDLARYADTNGYEKDRPRSIWPYRDWVIRALNEDMPFDQFSIEQIAGDMLPNATLDQRIATGFHRNTMLNEEGGIDPLEFRFYAMVDRVATTGTVWMGLTTGCAQCHTHKYDPITHTDYFGMFAMLNNADEPEVTVPDPAIGKRRKEVQSKLDAEQEKLVAQVDEPKFQAWWEAQKAARVEWKSLEPVSMESNLPKLTHEGDGVVFANGDFTKRDVFTLEFEFPKLDQPVTAFRLEALPDERLPKGGPGRAYYEGRSGDFFLSEMKVEVDGRELEFIKGSQSYGKISVGSGKAAAMNVVDGEGSTGWSTSGGEGRPHEIVLNLKEPLADGSKVHVELLFERHFVAALGKFRVSLTTKAGEVVASKAPEFDPVTATVAEAKARYVLAAPELAETRKRLEALRRSLPALPTTLVMQEWAPGDVRPTHRHHRGEYLKAEERVEPTVPVVFGGLKEGEPANRLTFAKWLVDAERNPLVARTFVNRTWNAFFGRGFVPTLADLGLQSELPSHPELLDWLSVTWVEEDGWSMKKLHKRIVMSATYRQSSVVTPSLLKKDPNNILLARGPRFRMEAEMIRDAALKIGGLLSPKIGGPSVYPPQPAGVSEAAYGSPKWNVSKGADRYRRSLYTFAKRTAPFAAYLTFDGPTGESCIAQRDRSNTPLQALTLMNDVMFGEAAKALARRVPREGRPPAAIASAMFRHVLNRNPTKAEVGDLAAYFEAQRQRLAEGELDPVAFGVGEKATPEDVAWTLVARALFNLDEFVTKG
jgi:hypothetical protein